jgi:hypothetical protein
MSVKYRNEDASAGELLAELRKPGKACITVLNKHDPEMVQMVKSSLIHRMEGFIKYNDPDEESGFSFCRHEDGDPTIDTAY